MIDNLFNYLQSLLLLPRSSERLLQGYCWMVPPLAKLSYEKTYDKELKFTHITATRSTVV